MFIAFVIFASDTVNTYMSSLNLCASLPGALLGSCAISALYVYSLYACARYRRDGGRAPDRNDPRVVKERFFRVGMACVLSPPVALMATAVPGGRDASCVASAIDAPLAQWFGLWAPSIGSLLLASILPLLLTMVLFLGPLVMAHLDDDAEATLVWSPRRLIDSLSELQTLRNLVVGPITEEWVFRACMCPLLFGAGLGDAANVFTSGALFGLAHVHHVFDADHSWMVVAVQFTYTTLFGAYSSYLFLRTGLVIGPVLAHAFCNSQGLPNFGGIRHHPQSRLVGGAFVTGLVGFAALCALDAVYRPRLFGSLMWPEA